jgi:hypothetical protein
MRYCLQKTFLAVVAAVITALTPSGTLSAEVTTVVLPENPPQILTISADKADSIHTEQLTFRVDAPPTPGAKVSGCVLRVVPTPQPPHPRADQTVSILWNDETNPVGFWKAFSKTTQPYAPQLAVKACAPGTNRLTLVTRSEFTSWDYYSAGAPTRADLPRLIVTYDSPAPAHSGNQTDWAYNRPASFFSSKLGSSPMLTNPVSWDGALYYVAGTNLFRMSGPRNVVMRPIDAKIIAGSFAFVSAWGRLRLLTTNAILSCDLNSQPWSNSQLACATTAPGEKIALKASDAPVMGPDGSLYFKNIEEGSSGSVVAYNPRNQEIWQSSLKFTDVSSIALNASGRYAYMLGDISVQGSSEARRISLLRIDTATGDTVENQISYGAPGHEIKPIVAELRAPAVVSRVVNGKSVDYIFTAGNMPGMGVLQLVAFDPQARCVWSQLGQQGVRTAFSCKANPSAEQPAKALGKVSAAPVSSLDGNYMFVAWEDGTIFRYPWFNTVAGEEGAFTAADLKPEELDRNEKVSGVSTILVDGGGSVYLNANNSLYAYDTGGKKIIHSGVNANSSTLVFTQDGTLIGYTKGDLFDFSPKSAQSTPPATFGINTIYSADTVTFPGNPDIKSDSRVILKGNNISFPPANFTWRPGATLKVVSIPK